MNNWCEPYWIVGAGRVFPSTVIGRKLRGAVTWDDDYGWLWFGVINRAVEDLFSSQDGIREDAESFLFSDRLLPVADSLGLSADWVRDVIFAVTEAALEQIPPKSSQPEKAFTFPTSGA